MTTEATAGSDGAQWPSVETAYGFVLPSYQMVASRFEAADSRIAALLSTAMTLTLAAPLFAKAVRPDISFGSRWFFAGMALFVVTVVLGLFGRLKGNLTLPDPMVHYNTSLHESDWTFKKNAIFFAGEHFDANVRAVRVKGNFSIAMTVSLVLEILLFIVWISI